MTADSTQQVAPVGAVVIVTIPTGIRRDSRIVGALDTAIKQEFAGDRDTLFKWDDAQRIKGKLGRPKKKRRRRGPPS